MADSHPERDRSSGFAALCLGQFLGHQTGLTFSALIPIVSAEWQLSASQAGLILGAFQLGIGSTLLLALVWTDALLAALAGASAGGILHFSAHVQDRHLGGRTSDPASIGVIAALLVVGAVLQARAVGRKGAG